MPVIRQRQADGIDIRPEQYGAKILEHKTIVRAVMGVDQIARLIKIRVIHITHCDHLSALFLQKSAQIAGPHAAHADKRHGDALTRGKVT
ncbi:MAG: hypothetical protein BWY83_03277 [bacterium ADurb.Bin478]|nr:MAG: hypothetical protein BWY83_03277 [bacterium ADurb.Bin478]